MDRIIEKKRGLRPRHIPFVVGGALLLILMLWAVMGSHQNTLNVDARDVTIGRVSQGEFKD